MEKHPKATQINPSTGTRPYAQDKGGYVQKMRRVTDSGVGYMLRELKKFMAHSEFKKPYASPTYDDMEYGFEPWNWPTFPIPPIPGFPPPGPNPGVSPAPAPPPPGPGPEPQPGPGPSPGGGGGWWNNIYFCQVPDFEFCPGGSPVMVPVITNDGITQAGVDFASAGSAQGAGNAVIYTPGGSTIAGINVTTRHGATCSGLGHAKDPALCISCGAPSIGYTTTVMGFSESQTFSVVGGGSGPYTWSVSGGGTINSSTGDYVSPPSNSNCTLIPTITLTCGGTVMATLTLTITNTSYDACAAAALIYSYRDMTYNIHVPPHNDGMCCSNYYNCSGVLIPIATCGGGSSVYCTQTYPTYQNHAEFPVAESCSNISQDLRSGAMKTAGCCPPQLM